ncbi:predicted protein [Nematostella vectensis]|uniref:Uncharacterized protein n=1 Tax=Nematostella vectensis TaxID=45351 RepID=A7SKN5_NEMVE|nr:predicted protein [Nematostella vectensis]|eukprot:XP_001647526.1 predicted protein [Nematostella vectensis]
MMETLSIATSATVLPALLACVIAFYVFFHCLTTEKKGQDSSKIPMQSVRGKLQRKLDKVEKAMVGMGKFGPGSGIDVNVLLVESSCSLEQEMVVKALGLLARKYPLLRMRLVEGDDDLSHFIELDDFVTPSFRRGQSSSTDWERCFAEDKHGANIKSSFNVSMRKECLPEVKPDEFGCFISIIQQQTNVQTKQEYTKEEFWKLAAEFTSKVHGMMKQQKHFEFVKFLNNVNFKSFQNSLGEGGRFDNIFNISNRGRYVIGTEDTGPFKFNGTYFAMAEQHCGPVFTNNLVSVNGKLFWGLVYYPHILTEEQASQFINLTLCILRKAIA